MNKEKKYNFFKNIGYALDGLKYLVTKERTFQIELMTILAVSLLSFLTGLIELIEFLFLMPCFLLVLICEAINTAIESVVDLCVGDKFHLLAKYSKDTASGAVFLSILNACFFYFYFVFN